MGATPPALLTVYAVSTFIFGLLLGSFANVLIARLPKGESIVWPGSKCPHCQSPIAGYDNIPVVSWLVLLGKCRHCKAPISPRYPLVELLTGLLFLAAFRRFGPGIPLFAALTLIFVLVPLTFIDLEHWILPYELTLPGLAMGLLLSGLMGLGALRDSAIGAAIGFFVFWGLEKVGRWVFKKEALGEGDKYLLALIGAFLSYRPLLGIIFLSSFQGSLVGLTLLAVYGRAGPELKPESGGAPDAGNQNLSPVERAPGSTEVLQSHSEAKGPGLPGPEGPTPDPENDWVPGPTNMPFGPWLALAALEILLLAPWLASKLPPGVALMLLGALEPR